MALGRFIRMIESMLNAGKFQIAGEEDVFESKADVDAALHERGERMESVWYPASEVSGAPEWATKIYYLRTLTTHRRVSNSAFVFAE